MNRLVIPTVFALKDKDYQKRFETAKKISRRVHVDVMDGSFVKAESPSLDVLAPSDYNEIDVHLMVRKPLKYLDSLRRLRAKRVYVHVEIDNPNDLIQTIQKIKEAGFETYIALNPETNSDEIIPFGVHINGCLIMSVHPGREGQAFIMSTHRKIREISRFIGNKEIAVDGGITKEVAEALRNYNVNVLAVGSAIANSLNPEKRLEEIKEVFER